MEVVYETTVVHSKNTWVIWGDQNASYLDAPIVA